MPRLARWFIKTALIYFGAALFVGLMLASGIPIPGLMPVYFHLLMVGWVTQLIFGVAYWMFPKASQAQPRGNENLAWAIYFLINVGLGLRAVGEPLNARYPGAGWGWLLVGSAFLQWLGGIAFVITTWPRVKER